VFRRSDECVVFAEILQEYRSCNKITGVLEKRRSAVPRAHVS
jgi:hypothetical protein